MRASVAVLFPLVLVFACTQGARERVEPRAEVEPPAPAHSAPAPDAAKVQLPPEPSAPPAKLFAKRFVVKVREAPSKEAFRLGYLRGGAVLQAKTAEPVGYDECRKGWYELETGGFVCSTVDAIVFSGQRLPERRARQPDLSAPLPYPYGYSRRRDTPVFRRLPSADEAALHEGRRTAGKAGAVVGVAVDVPIRPGASSAAGIPVDGGLPDVSPPSQIFETNAAAAVPGEGEARLDAGVPTLASLLGEEGSVLHRRMERGFYVSLDREMEKGARKYWRTQMNGFIPARGLALIAPREFHGVELAEQGAGLPLGFVMSKEAAAYTANERGRLRRGDRPGYHHAFAIASEVELRGTRYYVEADGRHYRARDVIRVDPRDKPGEVGPAEKWIDVDLATQSLVAYVGARPVFATLISSGRVKDELDPLKNFETPTGSFRITSKHLTATMDGDHAIDGPYSIEDVPYVMYFELAYALHSAFWHNGFGRPRSHGCINLAPRDAKWLFEFATPDLPPLWHGVFPTDQAPGTRLYIRGKTPIR